MLHQLSPVDIPWTRPLAKLFLFKLQRITTHNYVTSIPIDARYSMHYGRYIPNSHNANNANACHALRNLKRNGNSQNYRVPSIFLRANKLLMFCWDPKSCELRNSIDLLVLIYNKLYQGAYNGVNMTEHDQRDLELFPKAPCLGDFHDKRHNRQLCWHVFKSDCAKQTTKV